MEDTSGSRNTITVTDNRTGKTREMNIVKGTVNATDFVPLQLRLYDPGFQNTASCRSQICFIDGEKGILTYRGYPIQELAENSTFLEVAFLLIYGSLPVKGQLDAWTTRVMRHTFIHSSLAYLMRNFRYDAHPMGMVISALAAMGTFHAEQNPALAGVDVYKKHPEIRAKQIFRILGKAPTIAACAYRHRVGRPYNNPVNYLNYTENFLCMLDRLSESDYHPHPKLAHALDVLFILHAEHELNCSTAALRHLLSSGVDIYTAIAGASGALYGPSHGGANEAVVRMLMRIGTTENIPKFIDAVKNRKERLMGFGHRVYRNYDPRAKIVQKVADEVFSVVGKDPLIDVAKELERVALHDDYFIQRKLYPNVDFYSGIIYRAMGFPTDMFPVLFTIPRMAGWLAHWVEFLEDSEFRIVRPRQRYEGPGERHYTPVGQRTAEVERFRVEGMSTWSKRAFTV